MKVGMKIDWWIKSFAFLTQLSLRHNRPVQHLEPQSPPSLLLCSTPTCEQHPKMLEFLPLRQTTHSLHPEWAIHLLPTEDHGLSNAQSVCYVTLSARLPHMLLSPLLLFSLSFSLISLFFPLYIHPLYPKDLSQSVSWARHHPHNSTYTQRHFIQIIKWIASYRSEWS